ncbi:MAG: protein kinase [Deltaproteobacteria bacterium]|nr:protein kinase [Deltaproteobacteria bacterium]
MSGEDEGRTRKHSQEKVLRAFLDHVTGSVPAAKPGVRISSPPPEGGSPPGGVVPIPAVVHGAEPHVRPPSTPPSGRRRSMPYAVTPPDSAAVDRRPDPMPPTGRHRRLPSSPPGPPSGAGVGSAPTEIRPSPHEGVVPEGGAGMVRVSPLPGPAPAPSGQASAVHAGALLGGKYRLVKMLGRGGVGEVWEAVHDVIGLRVAVKLIRFEYAGNPELNARFIQEARAAAAVGHPGIVQVHDVGTSPDGRAYLVLEFLEGEDFEKVLARQRRLSVGETAEVLVDALDALGAAHAKGIVHRDMKPENVFLVPGRKGERVVKLVDFGIARLADETDSAMRLTRPGAVMGTPYYMSPEQARGEAEVDPGVDIYAVGVMLFEALAGRLPFMGSSYNEVLSKVLAEPFPSIRETRPDVPVEVERIIGRACARERGERFRDAAEFGEALAPFGRPRGAARRGNSSGEGLAAVRTSSVSTPVPAVSPSSVPPPAADNEPRTAPAAETSAGEGATADVASATSTAAGSRLPPPAPGAEGSPAIEVEPGASDPPRRTRSWGLYAANALLLVGLLAVAAFFLFRGGGDGGGQGRAAGTSGAAADQAAVEIRVIGVPEGAEVRFDGRSVGTEFEVPAARDEHWVEVRAPGRWPVVRMVRPNADLTLDLRSEFGEGASEGGSSAP